MTETHNDIAVNAAFEAGKAILDIYESDNFNVEFKGDNSPLTKADKKAHNIIVSYLNDTNYPILSEEGRDIDFEERKSWKTFWMIDPLDGTKEFIKRNGEFTVNIALIHNYKPIFGVVYAPVLKKLYVGGINTNPYIVENDVKTNLVIKKSKDSIVRIVASRSHLNKETEDFIEGFNDYEIVSMGSSLKFMVIAEGNADIYPRFAPTMEWDTAAAHAILKSIGINVIDQETKEELIYNKKNLLNPFFLVNNH